MNKYQKHFLGQTLALGLPINSAGYAEDELLFIDQFINEYAAHGIDVAKEIDLGRLSILTRGHKILIARSDAEDWYDKHYRLLMDRLLNEDSTEKSRHSKSTLRF